MNAENINQILDALAARFGATGAELWSILVKAEVISGITNIVSTFGLIIVSLFVLIFTFKFEQKKGSPFMDFSGAVILFIISCLVLSISTLTFFMYIGYNMVSILAPEAAIIRGLVQ